MDMVRWKLTAFHVNVIRLSPPHDIGQVSLSNLSDEDSGTNPRSLKCRPIPDLTCGITLQSSLSSVVNKTHAVTHSSGLLSAFCPRRAKMRLYELLGGGGQVRIHVQSMW